MDEQEFLGRIKAKIEGLTSREVQLHVDMADENRIKVDLGPQLPQVTMGSNALKYSGFGRMVIEYAVASIREGREIGPLEFHVLLARN